MTKKKRLAIIGGTVIGTLEIAAAGVAVANATEAGSRAVSIVAGITGAGHGHGPDGMGPDRPMEEPLTGDDATKVVGVNGNGRRAALTGADAATQRRGEEHGDEAGSGDGGNASFRSHPAITPLGD